MAFSIGIDFGTNSVRALVAATDTGKELGTGVFAYPSGKSGILLEARDPDLARQNPADYLQGLVESVRGALQQASAHDGFDPEHVVGIGVDTTGSTPMPVDARGQPLAFDERFRSNLDAHVWLWKDHTAHAEAAEITRAARKLRPEYLAKCGGTYSSEWFWSKLLHCRRASPDVFDAAHTWVEHADWIPALLTGSEHPAHIRRGICAAGHKGMFGAAWGGYPDKEFLSALDSGLARVRDTLPDIACNLSEPAGRLTTNWASRLGLPAGIPVATGALDAHLGAVGSGIGPGVLVKIMGTSTCDLVVAPLDQQAEDIPGLCGIVPESVLPGHFGMEAGQSAVGDIFNWLVEEVGPKGLDHDALSEQAEALKPGESGLLALDWHNGNRTVLVDQRLTGLILGLTLHSSPAEIYRAMVEATAFGARVILERFEAYSVSIGQIVACGGISAKNRLVMQIYADVLKRPLMISRSSQTPALGAAMAGAVVAGKGAGGHDTFGEAARAMTGVRGSAFKPATEHASVYDRLYELYRRLHDAFGTAQDAGSLYDVMKTLLEIRDEARR